MQNLSSAEYDTGTPRMRRIERLRLEARTVAANVLAAEADEIGREARWPSEGMAALVETGLLGSHVPERLGGLDEGLLALPVVTEEIGMWIGVEVDPQPIVWKAPANPQEKHLGWGPNRRRSGPQLVQQTRTTSVAYY